VLATLKFILYSFVLATLSVFALLSYMTWMPTADFEGDEREIEFESSGLEVRLREHVVRLSKSTVGRNIIFADNLTPARNYIAKQFTNMGFNPRYQSYEIEGDEYSNIIVDIPSSVKGAPVLIVGAHYDSVENSPGANDNASGVAALIEIGRYFSGKQPLHNHLRLIAFANEEPPFFHTDAMGSMVYAKTLSARDEIILGMISLETIGYYSDKKDSQKYPRLFDQFYPDQGNFLSFVGNFHSRNFLTSSIKLFREQSKVPSEGVVSPVFVPGVGWSDHWSFWKADLNAIMVTDTALYRYRHYHETSDTPDKLNYEYYAKVVFGLYKVVEGLLAQEND
jgi:hypothetical protein